MENPSQIIRSWNLQGTFAGGRVVEDKLVPKPFTRIRTPFIQTWREEQLNANLDWGSRGFSFYLPESLRVISTMYLQINLPAITGGGNYKPAPGLYAVESIRFLSAGQEAYTVDVQLHLRDYIESLDTEHAQAFIDTYLGGSTATSVARTILVPIMLPNSAYLGRAGQNHLGHGVWPCYTGQNRLEFQISMAGASYVAQLPANIPASISTEISMLIHQVDMKADDVLRYSDVRGAYSVINRRFTEVTTGWEEATGGVMHTLTQNQPIGCVTELFVIASAHLAAEDATKREILQNVSPDYFEIISDSVVQKSLNTSKKVEVEKWTNGFTGNTLCNVASRLCFAAHAADAGSMYSGGYNMQLSSQITVKIRFPSHVDFRIYAVQLQRVTVSPMGLLQASLE